jgi:hypothetical protein
LRFAKWLANPSGWNKIAENNQQDQLEAMNNKSSRKSPMKAFLCSALAASTLATIVIGTAPSTRAGTPFCEIGAKATTDYQGDVLGITANPGGVLLRCNFQRLVAHATAEGIWLESTVPGDSARFRMTASALFRDGVSACAGALTKTQAWKATAPADARVRTVLSATGAVAVGDKTVRFARHGLTEEYSVSVDGVRQDFVITERPAGVGDLRLELVLSGARAEAATYGARLVLEGAGRALAYSRLRVTDAKGRQLSASLEVLLPNRLAVRVADANATYPVRIDPTFSDANWVSLNPGFPGVDGEVNAIATDVSGNVYVGGSFSSAGTMPANSIAKWDGRTWSALGSGMDDVVWALAVSGTNLYAGGWFSTAGGVPVNDIAKWDGSTWSPLGSGMDGSVLALAVSGTNLYAGGEFTNAGGVSAIDIAEWNGSSWSALGLGIGGEYDSAVSALAVSGNTLYAGGSFTTAGGVSATNIARWNGSSWSALGPGIGDSVSALAVSGNTLYAGGFFTNVGGVTANYVAEWDGNAWSPLGSGLDYVVWALAVSGSTLYAGGAFGIAGGVEVNYIAQWDGSGWSAVGSGLVGGAPGMDLDVNALAVSGTTLYAGGGIHLGRQLLGLRNRRLER